MNRLCRFIAVLVGVGFGSVMAESPPSVAVLDLGRAGDDASLGYGWSVRESMKGRSFRWVNRMEADIWLSLDQPQNLMLHMEAAVAWLDWRKQRIGLFVNNRYVTEWAGPDDHPFKTYEAFVPADYWVAGRNRLTLRMAYETRIGQDSRKLSLAVDRIELRSP